MRRTTALPLMLAALALSALPVAAQTPDFRWHGRLAPGKRVEVKGVNGDVRAVAATGSEVEVTAAKHARRSDPDDVKIEVIEHEGGVTICAVYPTPRRARQENSCQVGNSWHSSTEDNDVTVDFEVRIPAGVEFGGQTVNGEMSAEGLKADVTASTVNGSVRVTTTGLAEASTVNGSVYVEMGRADWTNELEFSTVNGGLTLVLPASLNAEIRASTVNGDLVTDYPLTITGRFGKRRMQGTIGSGGRSLNLSTVNGEIRLRKAT
jgi:putative adhesin